MFQRCYRWIHTTRETPLPITMAGVPGQKIECLFIHITNRLCTRAQQAGPL
ncbi:MAG: hypothetical protein K9L30_10675 [Desulfobacterales bacterium]|nr:hypothetical protein [Desulfobacterales bacterium]